MHRTLANMSQTSHGNVHHVDTIVLGAGMAGLACASRLYQDQRYRGQSDRLLVLEARDRVGGRIGSVHVNGKRLDTGANWIHGVGTDEEPNPLMQILPHKRYRQLSGMVAFRADGGRTAEDVVDQDEWVEVSNHHSRQRLADPASLVVPSEMSGPMMGALWGMIGSLHEMAFSTPPHEAKQLPILQAMKRTGVLTEAFKATPKDLHRTLGCLPQFIENMEAAPLAAQSAEHSLDQASMGLLEYAIDDFEGDQVFLQDGYTAIVDEVAGDLLRDGLVKMAVEVKHVKWDADVITIETTGKATYTANRVVCTLPLGVLQNHHGSRASAAAPLFQPELPAAKVDAISSLGFGTLDKIFLVYDSPWWTKEPYISILKPGIIRRPFGTAPDGVDDMDGSSPGIDSFFGFTNELAGVEIAPDGTSRTGPRSLSLINLHSLTGYPVLSCFVSCANAVQIEAMADSEAGDLLTRALMAWLGCQSPSQQGTSCSVPAPPTPEAVHVTRWASDPFSRGSYSHMTAGLSKKEHREEFQRPLTSAGGKAELSFAGEHTSSEHFATVHGALMSGWREADRILREANLMA